jgi:hypothetical protein
MSRRRAQWFITLAQVGQIHQRARGIVGNQLAHVAMLR